MAERVMSPRPATQWTWRDVVVLALTCAVALYRFSYTVADPDLWGHVKFGELFLRNGIVREDPYSYLTRGVPWTDHEWLSEVFFYVAFAAGGVSFSSPSRRGPPAGYGRAPSFSSSGRISTPDSSQVSRFSPCGAR